MTSSVYHDATSSPFPWPGLLTLSAAVFLSITMEMLPTGLLPDMSQELGVSQPQIGLLVTVFAFTVVVTSIPLTVLTRRMPRNLLLVAVLLVIGLSATLTAIAPNYAIVLVSRVLGGAAHGLFWAVVGAYAAHLVPPAQVAKAVAITTGGGAVALVLGVPLGALLGHAFGWRLSFGGLAVLMLLGAFMVFRLLPPVKHYSISTEAQMVVAPLRSDVTLVPVVIICAVTGITMVGQYTLYTYVAPYLTDVLGVASADVGVMLLVMGIAGIGGLALAGTVLGKRPTRGLIATTIATGVFVAVMAIFAHIPWLAIMAFTLWGLAFGALPPLLNTRLLHAASRRIRDAASALYTTAFNIGIGGGALLGAALFGVTGLEGLPWVFVGIFALAALAMILTLRTRKPSLD